MRQENADKRPSASLKYVRISPDKVRIVINIIRGQKYSDALAILKNTPKAACEVLIKLLNSAAANAENNMNLSKSDLYVAECYADQGPILKRVQPRAQGRAFRINKRTSHITVILDTVKD
ncbi:MAG: 50S ribosomal protein L22 [Clostridia bacterium]